MSLSQVPNNYICINCKLIGDHYIMNCPLIKSVAKSNPSKAKLISAYCFVVTLGRISSDIIKMIKLFYPTFSWNQKYNGDIDVKFIGLNRIKAQRPKDGKYYRGFTVIADCEASSSSNSKCEYEVKLNVDPNVFIGFVIQKDDKVYEQIDKGVELYGRGYYIWDQGFVGGDDGYITLQNSINAKDIVKLIINFKNRTINFYHNDTLISNTHRNIEDGIYIPAIMAHKDIDIECMQWTKD